MVGEQGSLLDEAGVPEARAGIRRALFAFACRVIKGQILFELWVKAKLKKRKKKTSLKTLHLKLER